MVKVMSENGYVLTVQPTRGLANQWLIENYPTFEIKESKRSSGLSESVRKQIMPYAVYFEKVEGEYGY